VFKPFEECEIITLATDVSYSTKFYQTWLPR